MQVGLVSLGLGKQSLEEMIAVAQVTGCETIELNGRATVHQGVWIEHGAPAVAAQVAAAGLRIGSLGGYCSMAQVTDEGLAEQVEQFVAYCATARDLGIPVVRAFAGDLVEGQTLDTLYPRLVAGFKAVMARVSVWPIQVGIENHGRLINHGDWLASLIRDVGAPNLGLTLDTGNFCWAGHSIDAAHRFFERLAPLTVNVHVKDGRFVDGAFELLPAGRGDLDLAALLKRLAQCGYGGQVLSEYEGHDDFARATLESVAYLRGLVAGVCA
jgi:sugar phosphate isomerase/epimerase